MMRVLALLPGALNEAGGIAQFNRDLIDALGASGEVIFVARDSDKRKSLKQFAYYEKALYALKAVQTLWKEKPFDLIFCGHLFMAPLCGWLSKLQSVPFWVHVHGIEGWRRPNRWIEKSLTRAACVTTASRFTRKKLLQWADVWPGSVKVLPDTFENRFQPGAKPKYLMDRYGLEGKRVLLTVGRMDARERYKGHDRIIALLPKIIREYPNIVYVAVGRGSDIARLKKASEDCGVSKHTLFLGDVPREELPDSYRMADVFVMPSTGEGFGIVFLEAAACGLSVIGGNQDGSVDALQEGSIGRIVDPTSETELLEAVLKALAADRPKESKVERFSRKKFSEYTRLIAHEIVRNSKNG